MTLFWNNLIDLPGVIITAATANTALPASNLTNFFRKKVYATTNTAGPESLVFDLLSAYAVTSVILLDHNLIGGDTVTIQRSSNGAAWTTVATPAITSSYILCNFGSLNYRYWKIVITKADSNPRQIGRVFIGTNYSTTEAADYSGVKVTNVDNSAVTKSSGGQSWTDVKEQYDMLSVPFSTSPDGQVQQLATIFKTVGLAVPIFLQIDSTVQSNLYYCKFSKGSDRTIKAFDSQIYWDVTLNFEEQI